MQIGQGGAVYLDHSLPTLFENTVFRKGGQRLHAGLHSSPPAACSKGQRAQHAQDTLVCGRMWQRTALPSFSTAAGTAGFSGGGIATAVAGDVTMKNCRQVLASPHAGVCSLSLSVVNSHAFVALALHLRMTAYFTHHAALFRSPCNVVHNQSSSQAWFGTSHLCVSLSFTLHVSLQRGRELLVLPRQRPVLP